MAYSKSKLSKKFKITCKIYDDLRQTLYLGASYNVDKKKTLKEFSTKNRKHKKTGRHIKIFSGGYNFLKMSAIKGT